MRRGLASVLLRPRQGQPSPVGELLLELLDQYGVRGLLGVHASRAPVPRQVGLDEAGDLFTKTLVGLAELEVHEV